MGSNPYYEGQSFTESPYYEGLTDSSLVINRQRLPVSSLGRENYPATSVNSSSRSSIIVKMQGWGSCCFRGGSKNKEEKHSTISEKINNRTQDTVVTYPSSSSSSSKTKEMNRMAIARTTNKVVKDMNVEKEDISSVKENDNTAISNKGKPLRERVSEPPPPQISPRARAQTSTPTNERQFIWADKYRPDALQDFLCNRDKALEVQALAKAGDCGNFIFEGPAGVGKTTMIKAALREIFEADKIQAREECKKFDLKGEALDSILVNLKESSRHVEINLSELKGYEKHVIIQLIKENKISISECNPENCRAIILNEADKLSTDALLYIRWILERYKGCNKFLFCCTDASKLQPINLICTTVQLLPPSNEEIVEVLEFIAKQEGIDLPHQLAVKMANNSKNNLRQAIRSFEATWQFNPSLKEEQVIKTGWEDSIANIAKNIVEDQSPKQLYNIRGKLQNLIEHNVSPQFTFQSIREELKKNLNEQVHPQIDDLYDEYNRDDDSEKPFAFANSRHEEMSKKSNDPVSKNIHHFTKIEEFIAQFMSCYKKYGCQYKGV